MGVEGTSSYGAGLTQVLLDQQLPVLEVNRPNRQARRQHGKSDPIDAEAAARAVLAGTATALPNRGDGIVAAIRVPRAARSGAVKTRTPRSTSSRPAGHAPAALREALQAQGRSTAALVIACARLRPDPTRLAEPTQPTTAPCRPSPSASRRWRSRSPWPTNRSASS